MTKNLKFKGFNCKISYSKYNEGGTCIDLIDLEDGLPVARATVNVPGITLMGNEVVIKDYSENEGMYDALVEHGIIRKTPKEIQLSEFVTAPIATLK